MTRCTRSRPRCTGQAVGNACTCPPRLYPFAADVLATLVERRRTYGELVLVLFRVVLTTPATLSYAQRLRLRRAIAEFPELLRDPVVADAANVRHRR